MRVISGEARGRRLQTLEGDEVRPTTDRVKESLFSIIQFDIPGSNVVDLFSGSGQLGIEAVSRGAGHCSFVDESRKSLDVTKSNIKTCGFEGKTSVFLGGAVSFLENTHNTFDIAILDPPYRKGLIDRTLPVLTPKMSQNGLIICEASAEEKLPEKAGDFSLTREYRYGKIKLVVYKRDKQ
ncbi:MAG: 16S rRNA (guanine(966)-N(2))-methyltransferase RsmD [Clostridiales bacterium]|nr:16S rRNA (guanine(966)-N(2))-methyltransferase RsmD [Clostridiales bacterium]